MGSSYPDKVRREERAEIRRRYRRRGNKAAMSALRVAELEREFTDRYRREILPDDDGGRDDVWIMANHLGRRTAYPLALIVEWLDRRAPWFIGKERDNLIAKVIENPLRWKADTLAKKIGLTAERRARLRIRTIGACDQTAAERKQARRLKSIERKRAIRRAAGKPLRHERRRNSVNSQAPWKAAGIDRSTWFRRRARNRAATSTATV